MTAPPAKIPAVHQNAVVYPCALLAEYAEQGLRPAR
jgi:hypothetical protein